MWFKAVDCNVARMKGPYFGSILTFLQILGIFPCKKVLNTETNVVYLEPVNWWIQCLTYILTTVTVNLLTPISFFVAYKTTPYNPDKAEYQDFLSFVLLIESKGYSFGSSKFDENVFACLAGLLFVLNFIVFIQLFKSRENLCNVYRDFEFADYKIDDEFCKILKMHVVKIFVILGCMQIVFVGLALKLKELFNISILNMVFIGCTNGLHMLWMFSSILAFHFIFLESLLKIKSWIISMKQKLHLYPKLHLEECEALLTGLQMFTKAISSTIFWLFSFLLLVSIVEAYLTISFLLSSVEFNIATLLHMIGFGFFGVLFIYLTYSYCILSQSIKDSVDEIRDIILKSNIDEEEIYVLDGKILRSMQSEIKMQKKRIILGFEQFEGFHGNGYFTLGKSLLTSVVANFITYLIILIQFKITETSSSQ